MKTLMITAAAVAALAAFAPAHAQSTQDCTNMLVAAVGNALDAGGFDTTNICNLTVAHLAQIQSAMSQDGMNNETRALIEKLLAEAG